MIAHGDERMTTFDIDAQTIAAAAERLRAGGVVAFPTETVYGLGADATQENAVARIFEIKGRPSFNPLIVHVGRPDWIAGLAEPDGRVDILSRTFWPGPLTLVLRRRAGSPVAKAVSAGLDTIAVRQPDHPVAAQLLAATKRPLAAPSANPSGHVSPTLAAHVAADLGDKVDMILDGGPCRSGLESTVLDLTHDTARILRPGVIGASDLEQLIGAVERHIDPEDTDISSPGQLAKHYAPALAVRLNAEAAEKGEALIGFGAVEGADFNLSPAGDLHQAAAALFATLRAADDPARFSGIAVSPIPDEGPGHAINDRLRRAALGR